MNTCYKTQMKLPVEIWKRQMSKLSAQRNENEKLM